MMITQLGLIFLIIISLELIRFFEIKKLIKENLDIYKDLTKTFLNKYIDDELKQKEIIRCSKNLLKISFKIFLCIGIILLLIYMITFFDDNFIKFLLSILGILETIILFVLYALIRKKNE